MKQEYTYFQDTTTTKIPLKENVLPPGAGLLNNLSGTRNPLPALPNLDTTREKTTNTEQQEQPAPPTPAQIRYWWWQRENRILVGDSRYIQPKHELKVHTSAPSEKIGLVLPERKVEQTRADWLTILLIAGFLLVASIHSAWGKYLANLFKSVVNYPTTVRMLQEKNSSVIHAAARLDVLFYLIFPVFIFQLAIFFNLNVPFENFYLYVLALLILALFLLYKKLFYKILGHIFNAVAETNEFLFNLNNFNRIIGLVLLPLVTIIAFYPSPNIQIPVFSGIILAGFLYLKLLYRGFKVLITKQFSIFYLFLYFCTLEILPLILLYKIMTIQAKGLV